MLKGTHQRQDDPGFGNTALEDFPGGGFHARRNLRGPRLCVGGAHDFQHRRKSTIRPLANDLPIPRAGDGKRPWPRLVRHPAQHIPRRIFIIPRCGKGQRIKCCGVVCFGCCDARRLSRFLPPGAEFDIGTNRHGDIAAKPLRDGFIQPGLSGITDHQAVDFLFQRPGLVAAGFLVGLGGDGIRLGAFLRQDILENCFSPDARAFHDRGLVARGAQFEDGGEVLPRHAQQRNRERRALFESMGYVYPILRRPSCGIYPTFKKRRRAYCCAKQISPKQR